MPGQPVLKTAGLKPTKIGILLRVALYVVVAYLGLALFSLALYPLQQPFVAPIFVTFAAAAVANALLVRIFERGTLSDLGLQWGEGSGRQFAIGAGSAAACAVLCLAIPMLARLAVFEPAERPAHMAATVAFEIVFLLFGAAGEELLFHGYAFQLLARTIGAFATILPVGVLFGFRHSGNPNATLLSVANTMGWGILLGYAYVRTQALWMPIGMHFGWNLVLPLFGVNLSGIVIPVSGHELHWKTGDLWSGGSYGLEGGVLTSLVVIVLFIVVQRFTRSPEG
jgi:membrane protease YdiL (CAAX protease family)